MKMNNFAQPGPRDQALIELSEYFGTPLNGRLLKAYNDILGGLDDHKYFAVVEACKANPEILKFPKPFEFDMILRRDFNDMFAEAGNKNQCQWCDDDGFIPELSDFEGAPRLSYMACGRCRIGDSRKNALRLRNINFTFHNKFPQGQFEWDRSGDDSYCNVVMTEYQSTIGPIQVKRAEDNRINKTELAKSLELIEQGRPNAT